MGTETKHICDWSHACTFRDDVETYLCSVWEQYSPVISFDDLCTTLATPPLETCLRVNTLRISVDHAIDVLQKDLEESRAALKVGSEGEKPANASKLFEDMEPLDCNATNLNKSNSTFDDNINTHTEPSFRVYKHPLVSDVILVSDNRSSTPEKEKQIIPASHRFVLVDAACGAAVLRGAHVFIPGVRACSSGLHIGENVAVYADVRNACPHGQTTLYTGKTVFIGNGYVCFNRQDLFSQPPRLAHGIAVQMKERIFRAPCLGHLDKDLILQNLPSCLVAHILQPKSHERILDMCAAPGGKTSHLAALVENKGAIFALERSAPRAAALATWLHNIGVTCVTVAKMDATKCIRDGKYDRKHHWSSLNYDRFAVRENPGNPLVSSPASISQTSVLTKIYFDKRSFDCILLDAPCTGLGQRPRFHHPTCLTDILDAPKYQKKLFNVAVSLLKIGGRLVYSTCSINPEENEGVVAWALHTFPGLFLVEQKPFLGNEGLPYPGLDGKAQQLVQRFTPSSECQTIGFFIAKFELSSVATGPT